MKPIPYLMLALGLMAAPFAHGQVLSAGYWVEAGGLVVIEAESIGRFPDSWRTAANVTPPDLNNDAGLPSGGDFITWTGGQNFNTTGVSPLIYRVEIKTTGTYRFRWRSQTGKGTDTTEHNDTWLKIESASFFGQKNDSVKCPKGLSASENACVGGVPEGSGKNGWFKVFVSGANSWRWATRTSDNEGYDIFARFDTPGIYEIRLAARSSYHLVDRMVLNHEDFAGNAQDLDLPESTFVPGPDVVFLDSFETD